MKTILMSSAVVLSIASLAASAEETSSSFSWGNVTFQPRAYVGYADYELKSGNFNFIPNGGAVYHRPIGFFFTSPDFSQVDKIQFSGVLGGIGGTIASGPFFGDFYYQSTANEVATKSQEEHGLLDYSYDYSYGDGNAKHEDWALSLGYMITDQWSVFAGYKSGKTDFDQINFAQINFAQIDNGIINATIKLDGNFEQSGPFLGTAYSLQYGPGVLTFRIAYAYLDGTEKQAIDEETADPYFGFKYNLDHKLDGNSNAFSLGVSWTQQITDALGVSVGANYHRYKFNLSGGGQSEYYDGQQIGSTEITGGSLTESLFTLTASLIYRF